MQIKEYGGVEQAGWSATNLAKASTAIKNLKNSNRIRQIDLNITFDKSDIQSDPIRVSLGGTEDSPADAYKPELLVLLQRNVDLLTEDVRGWLGFAVKGE